MDVNSINFFFFKQPEYGSKPRVYFLLKAPVDFLVRYASESDVHKQSKNGDYVLVTPESLSQLKVREAHGENLLGKTLISNGYFTYLAFFRFSL